MSKFHVLSYEKILWLNPLLVVVYGLYKNLNKKL